jgi:hypothetical protein
MHITARSQTNILRTGVATPIAPLFVCASGLLAAWAWQVPWALWTVFAAITGYSLSGPT